MTKFPLLALPLSKKCIQVKALVAASRRCRRAVKSRGGDPSCQQCWEGRSRTELNLSLPICRFTRTPPPKFLDKIFSLSSATPTFLTRRRPAQDIATSMLMWSGTSLGTRVATSEALAWPARSRFETFPGGERELISNKGAFPFI